MKNPSRHDHKRVVSSQVLWLVFAVISAIAVVWWGQQLYSYLYDQGADGQRGQNTEATITVEAFELNEAEIKDRLARGQTDQVIVDAGLTRSDFVEDGGDFNDLTIDEIFEVIKQKAIEDATLRKKYGGDVDNEFSCIERENVEARGYVFVRALGQHDNDAIDPINKVAARDTHFGGILDFDYGETAPHIEITDEFVTEFDEFVASGEFDEIIIIANREGGVIISTAIDRLAYDVPIEVHTVDAPLAGYSIATMPDGAAGFERTVNESLGVYPEPAENVAVYHHKSAGMDLSDAWCVDGDKDCDPYEIQNNNVPESTQYIYSSEIRSTLLKTVIATVLGCKK